MLGRYISQTPQEDAVRLAMRDPYEDTSCPYLAALASMQKTIAQVDEVFIHDNASISCPYSFAGCPFTSSSKSPWMNHIQLCHLQCCPCTTKGSCGQLFNSVHPTDQPEFLFENQQRPCPTSMRCSAPECSMQFSGGDALQQWLDHVYTHLEHLATPDYSLTLFKAIEGNTEFIRWSSGPGTPIIRKTEPDGRWTLCKCLCKRLHDSTINVVPGSQQPLLHGSLTFNPKSSSVARSYLKDDISTTYTQSFGYLDVNCPKSHLSSRLPFVAFSHSLGIPSLMEGWKDDFPTISDHSSGSISVAMDEVFSRKSVSSAHTDLSHSHDDTAQHNLRSEQVSPSDLVHEFVHFTMSWFITWLANQANITKPNSDNQETQNRGGEGDGQSLHEKGRKRPRQNDIPGRNSKIRRTEETNEDEPDDGDGGTPIAADDRLDLGTGRLYACPFYQRCPPNYGQGKWKLCAHTGWKSYHRVRFV